MSRRRSRLSPPAWKRTPVLGLDIGGVLVDRVAEGQDTSFFGSEPMATPMVPGSLEAVLELVQMFDHRVHIVSKAGPKIAALSRQWMGKLGFTGDGAIPMGNVHFVRKRHEKAPVSSRLGITHFVDDRADVHSHLTDVDYRYLFTGGLGSHEPPRDVPEGVEVVSSWVRLSGLLQRDLADPRYST